MDLFDIYLLNLTVTIGMFIVLIFRAWLELKHFQVIWKEAEWRKTYEVVGRILRAEKDMFKGTEGGEQLYRILCEMFKVNEQKNNLT